jgi:hypothetical protein
MQTPLNAFLLAVLLLSNASLAQEASVTPKQTDTGEPSAATPLQKPYFVSPENMLTRCKVPEFLKCMKLTESQCVAVINSGTAEGNAKVEAEAALKSEAQTSSDYFKGYAMGVVIGKIHTASKGKLLGCLNVPKN